MKRRSVLLFTMLLCLSLLLGGCGTKSKALAKLLAEDTQALNCIKKGESVVCKDYTVYSLHGGIDDSMDATRYARGMVETQDRMVSFDYVAKNNTTGYKYIFQSFDDLVRWAKSGGKT